MGFRLVLLCSTVAKILSSEINVHAKADFTITRGALVSSSTTSTNSGTIHRPRLMRRAEVTPGGSLMSVDNKKPTHEEIAELGVPAPCKIFTLYEYPGKVPDVVQLNIETWRRHIGCQDVLFINDTNVKSVIPDMPDEYFKMPDASAKSDLIRYAVLSHHGGIYMDADFLVVRDLREQLLDRLRDHDLISYTYGSQNCSQGTFSSNFLAGRQGSILFTRVWEEQKAAVISHCDASELKAQEACCFNNSEQPCHIPWGSIGESIASKIAVKTLLGHPELKMFCFTGSESFSPDGLDDVLTQAPDMKTASEVLEQSGVKGPMQRKAYHLSNALWPMATMNTTELLNQSQFIGSLYTQSFISEPDFLATPSPASPPKRLPTLWPCRSNLPGMDSPEDAHMAEGVKKLCGSSRSQLMEAWVEPGFEDNFNMFYNKSGWIDEAFVSYFDGNVHETFRDMVELLIESVHTYSTRPIVIFNFGPTSGSIKGWTPQRFPRLLCMWARPMSPGISFNFNKIRAMILAHVRTGVQLDADQFVFRGVDALFASTRREGGPAYPYPILPVHWMARDPASQDGYSVYSFQCPDCPQRTMRWGHAHPTWTLYALPFLGGILAGELDNPRHVLKTEVSVPEDEDALNVGLWSVNANKQWCKFDVPDPSLFKLYAKQDQTQLNDCCTYSDTKWYPKGIPLVFVTAHAAKKPPQTRKILKMLAKLNSSTPSQVFFQGNFSNLDSAMQAGLPCLIPGAQTP